MSGQTRTMSAVELFCGAGGMGLGLRRAGFATVFANDCDRDSCDSYSLNHPETEVRCADIHDIDFSTVRSGLPVRSIDLLAGGPPCQGFSTVGSKREQDPRNSLFYEFIRAIHQLRPRCVLFENVSGFARLYEGRAFRALTEELCSLGYSHRAGVLNASDFGLPQHRLRTVIVAWRQGMGPIRLPASAYGVSDGLFAALPKRTLMDAIGDLPPLESGESKAVYLCPPQNDYQRALRGSVQALTEHSATQYGDRMREILRRIPPGGAVDDLPEALRPRGYFANTYARLRPNEPSPTITRNFGTPSSSRCVHPFQNRALSTREGARLQGFPDDYRFVGGKGSKNLQIGNAVPPVLGFVVGQAIAESVRAQTRSGAAASEEVASAGAGT